jgi:vacuolar fusion protein MON1
MGLLQALVSIVESDNENKLKYVLAGDHKVVFLHKSHLIFVCISNESEKCVEQLELELTYVYNQILSVVTLSLIEKVFARYNSYDLRNKLTGTEKLLTNIINRCENDYGMLLNCVNSYPLQMDVRDQIARIIAQQISSFRYVLFGLLLFDNKLVALIRPKTKNIHPIDVHLIVNVVTGLDTPKSAEFTWYPICLPNFNSSGMMYAYISHLDEQCKTCLILLTGLCDEDQSFELNECRKRIQQKLQTQSINQILNMKYIDQSLRLEQIGVPELKHFLFKDNKIFQYFVSEYALPYSASPQQQQRIYNIYQKLYHKLHNQTNNLKIIYMQQKYETILGWMTSSFEIYATFSSLVTKGYLLY